MESSVSDFMVNTCRWLPQPNLTRFNALVLVIIHTNSPVGNGDYRRIATSSGSASEFFIKPMLSCINDFDVMTHHNDQLAIPAGHPAPRCLPAEFHHEVEVYELEEIDFPCYKLVRSVCKLVKCTDSDNYARVPTEPIHVVAMIGQRRNWPAALIEEYFFAGDRCFDAHGSEIWKRSIDVVSCIRCLVWPPQAAEWTTRRRDHKWSDTATINCVIGNGCDIVQVAHPRCRERELVNMLQWRLSFSRAETVLLNTWSEIQQLVYHMLRVFVSTVQTYHRVSVIKRYYINTLLLWTSTFMENLRSEYLCAIVTRFIEVVDVRWIPDVFCSELQFIRWHTVAVFFN